MAELDDPSINGVAELAHPDETSIQDGEGGLRAEFIATVERAVEEGASGKLLELAGGLHEADLGSLIAALEPDARIKLIGLMGHEFDFTALTEIDTNLRDEILGQLSPQEVAEGVRELENDDAVTILEDLDKEEQAEILLALPLVDRADLQRSLNYPEDSAGRLMQTTLVVAPPFWTAGQAIDMMRNATEEELPDSFFEIFITDPAHRLLGNIFLDTLLRARSSARLDEIMTTDRRKVADTDERGEVARLFERYNLVSVPVVDSGERLLGVITIDDIVDVIQEEADEDLRALGGVSPSEELSDDFWWTTKSRFIWLFVNLMTAFIASAVLGLFEHQMEKMVALAVLAPIVASQGGNGATQTMTVVVRALATRQLTRANAGRLLLREFLVGALNGAAFGLLTGIVSGIWFGLPSLGIVIGLAMLINLIAGALGGLLIPRVLDHFEIDPAVASGAFVTTVTDVVGFYSFLGIATLWFRLG